MSVGDTSALLNLIDILNDADRLVENSIANHLQHEKSCISPRVYLFSWEAHQIKSPLTQWLSVSFLYSSSGTNMALAFEVMRKSRVRISQGKLLVLVILGEHHLISFTRTI